MFKKILIANRGEIALRLMRATADLGIAGVAVYAGDDAAAPHVRVATEAVALGPAGGANPAGAAAYLDGARLIGIARQTGCDALHPGYGFLSEHADFARACVDAGIAFIGPTPEILALFGDKARARDLAQAQTVPVLPGSVGAENLAQAQAFFEAQRDAGIMIKAIGGGGGRGMRAVREAAALPQAFARCVSEARATCATDGVYVERLMPHARQIEVQVIGDGVEVMHLGERECSLQRRFQKMVEIAPSPTLSPAMRERVVAAALRMARAVGYVNLGTFEFLVDERSADLPFVFIEANPRLQVEHTVTEAVAGCDLVQLQIALAAGVRLRTLGLDPAAPPAARGCAIQWRINAEILDAAGNARPTGGVLTRFDMPAGPGIRIDTYGAEGLAPSPHYDSLLVKLIVHAGDGFAAAVRRSRRALAECVVEGVATNIALLRALAERPEFDAQQVDTGFVETHLAGLLVQADRIRASTPVAAAVGRSAPESPALPEDTGPLMVRASMPARLVHLNVSPGEVVPGGHQLAVLEAMKMEHPVCAEAPARVLEIRAAVGDTLTEGQALILLEGLGEQEVAIVAETPADPGRIRPDLERLFARQAFTQDESRSAAVDRRHAQGGRTARENIADLCLLAPRAGLDADRTAGGDFIEYGAFAVAAQSRRRSMEDLIANTPADGMVTGIGTVNKRAFGAEKSRCAILAYDYTVLAGTQGWRNHHKKDRLLALAHQFELPVVLFAEGGGGRPGDVDMPIVAGLNNHTFSQFAALSGKVPVLGIVHGRCFAGNAALLGCADVIIATATSNIGMGGPAMIEGGGLGTWRPEQIGPVAVQVPNGVIDVLVADEAEAVSVAKRYLSCFQGDLAAWGSADQRLLRRAVPENRLRVYDVREVMRGLVDSGSLLELRAGFGLGILTGLARIEGRAVGLMANNPQHLGGAIDADAADKAARFMQLCDAHGLPLVSLVDTPGFMVGPNIEARAQVRHVCRMFVVAAHLRVPFLSVVLRKGYGLGAQAMTAGGFDAPLFNVAWPTGEFGGMGLEGAVRLGYRKELEAMPAGRERDALFRELVDQQYRKGAAISMATTLEIDAVIDPAQTRAWLVSGLAAARRAPRRRGKGRRFVDPW